VKPNSIGLLTNYYKFEISLAFFLIGIGFAT